MASRSILTLEAIDGHPGHSPARNSHIKPSSNQNILRLLTPNGELSLSIFLTKITT